MKASIQPGRDVNSNSTPTNNPFSRSNTLFESGSPSFISKSTALSVNGNVKERPSTKSSIWKGIGRVITSILCPELFKTGIFVTAVYSTALSILWFLIAVINPHWGNFISTSGLLTPSVASIIIAGFAKSIEVTFTTVMIVCLGQWLTKKARQRGVTMNDLQLRNMVLLPCALITQKGGFRALWQTKLLGFICVVAYIGWLWSSMRMTSTDAIQLQIFTPLPAML